VSLDFLGIGAQKAGTTWLHANLSHHPQIQFPAGKEVHFWDLKYERGLEWYRGLFPPASAGVIQGEITPAYGILPSERIEALRRAFGRLRLLFAVRDPVERAWSSALMALRRAEMEVDEASDQWFLDHFRSRGSLARGDYAACMRRWLQWFPSASLLVVRYEDIDQDPAHVLAEVCGHLGVNPAPLMPPGNPWLRRRVVPEGPTESPPLPVSLRAALDEIYEEPKRRLYSDYGIRWD
jgi:hypothetical protein